MPQVSVIIPCYNQAGYLGESVGSVLDQTYTDYEVIIVNDGSPDNTREVAEQIIAKHPGKAIRLVNQANRGLSGARNSGIAVSAGRYILPLDADDAIAPDCLMDCVRLLEGNPDISIAFPALLMFGDVLEENKGVVFGDEYDFRKLLKANRMPVCSMYRKKAWEQAGGYKEDMKDGCEDWEFWISLGELGHFGKLVNKPLFHYRIRKNSMYAATSKKIDRIFYVIRGHHLQMYFPRSLSLSRRLAELLNLVVLQKDLFKTYLRTHHAAFYSLVRRLNTADRRG